MHTKMLTSSAVNRDLTSPTTKGKLERVLKDMTRLRGVNGQPIVVIETFKTLGRRWHVEKAPKLVFVRRFAEGALKRRTREGFSVI
jgi:hypothetical protein